MDQVVIKEPTQVKAIMDGKAFIIQHPASRLLLIDSQQQVLAVYDKEEGAVYKSVRGLF
jgi:methyl coenzyme M reductase beta subunit